MATPVEVVLLTGVAAFDVYSFYKLKETEKEYKDKVKNQKPQDQMSRRSMSEASPIQPTEKVDAQKKLELPPESTSVEPVVVKVEEHPVEFEKKIDFEEKPLENYTTPVQELDARVFNLEKTLMTETHDRISRLEVRINSVSESLGNSLHEISSKIDAMPSSVDFMAKLESKFDDFDKKLKETNGNLEVVSMKVGLLEGKQEKFTDKVKVTLAKEHKAAEKKEKLLKKKAKKGKTTVVNVKPIVKVVNSKPKVQKKVSKPKPKTNVITVNPVVKVVNAKPATPKKVSKPKAANKPKTENTKTKGKNVEVNVKVSK
ncbi:Uncharacterised protein [uncultured archaeon]|nr:Uncharacterised protein [uncultured archaeon]